MKARPSSPVVHGYVQGGLGNQIFTSLAAAIAARLLQAELSLDLTRLHSASTHSDPGIAAFQIPSLLGDIPVTLGTTRASQLVGLLHRRWRASCIDAEIDDLYAGRIVPQVLVAKLRSRAKALRPRLYVKAYHQSAAVLSLLREFGVEVTARLARPTDWYIEQSGRALIDRPWAVHVRRGDYVQILGPRGLLTSRYYEESLDRLSWSSSNRPLWWFSDGSHEVLERMPRRIRQASLVVNPPKESPAAESLMLMSMAEGITIANSTYSWWAAALSKSRLVAYPSPWFPKSRYHQAMVLPQWIEVNSHLDP